MAAVIRKPSPRALRFESPQLHQEVRANRRDFLVRRIARCFRDLRRQKSVCQVHSRTSFSQDAVTAMLLSIMAGRGGMAQFSHPEFGGSGQWMAGGAIMISDMFNNALKARVDALCNELSALVRGEPGVVAADSFQSQSQGARGDFRGLSSNLLVTEGSDQANWWPNGPTLADLRRAAGGKLRIGHPQLLVAPHGVTIDLNCSAIQSITTRRRGDNCRVCE
jgi:hypothetical protein